MGIHGWRLLHPECLQLHGSIDNYNFSCISLTSPGDGDWCISVRPDSNHQNFLEHDGHVNSNGLVECEVKPSIDTTNPTANTDSEVMQDYLRHLHYQDVTIAGPWVADLSHTWDDQTCWQPCPSNGKTEIHPIFSLLHETQREQSKTIEFFVFSDDTTNPLLNALPPHTGEDIVQGFRIPLRADNHSYSVSWETDNAASKQFEVTNIDGLWYLQGIIHSGKPSNRKGFYNVGITVPRINPDPCPGQAKVVENIKAELKMWQDMLQHGKQGAGAMINAINKKLAKATKDLNLCRQQHNWAPDPPSTILMVSPVTL